MRIGIYDPYLDSLGGGEKYMLTAAVCLAQEHRVEIFWHDKSILHLAKEKFNLELANIQLVPNVFSLRTPIFKRLNETSKYDLIFILSDGSIPITFAKKTMLHFQFPVEWVKGNTIANKIKLQRLSHVICNSNFTKKYIDKKFNIKTNVLYPPCIPSPWRGEGQGEGEITKNKHNIVLTVGRYNALAEGSSFKKHEVMVNAWKEMIDRGLKNYEFIIATSYLEENKKHVDQLEIQTKNYPIKIVRNASFREISNLYQRAKIYWHAAGYGEDIDKHPERTEHFGISTVEAMYQTAVPVVIKAGGQTEIITSGQDGFLWSTTEELINYTQELIQHDTMRIKMGQAAREKAKSFSTDKFCQKLTKLII